MESGNISLTSGGQGFAHTYGQFQAPAQYRPADLLYFPRRIQRFTLPLQGLEDRRCCASRFTTAFLIREPLNRSALPISLDTIYTHPGPKG